MVPSFPTQITANGVVTFNDVFKAQPLSIPRTSGLVICPFWADTDTTNGTISHNNGSDANVTRVTQLIQESFGYTFTPTVVFTATWDGLPHDSAPLSKVSFLSS